MEIEPNELIVLLGWKEAELHVLRKKVAKLEAMVAQLAQEAESHPDKPQSVDPLLSMAANGVS
jgi:hypothetical protein